MTSSQKSCIFSRKLRIVFEQPSDAAPVRSCGVALSSCLKAGTKFAASSTTIVPALGATSSNVLSETSLNLSSSPSARSTLSCMSWAASATSSSTSPTFSPTASIASSSLSTASSTTSHNFCTNVSGSPSWWCVTLAGQQNKHAFLILPSPSRSWNFCWNQSGGVWPSAIFNVKPASFWKDVPRSSVVRVSGWRSSSSHFRTTSL
mmetsp:Transcript_42333/g.121594  ORF Transcript_42333/g.121594 Transcript_42333/m.121594 type:complete len:205 (-) Transcript_42333:307-921(-)